MPFALSQDADAERTLLTTVKTNSSKMPELPSLASGTRFLDDWRFHNILAICVAANAAAVGTTFATILFGSPAGFGASRLCRRASITLLTLSMLEKTLSFADSKSLLARSVFFVVIAAMTFAFLCDFDGPLLKRNLVFVVLSQQYQHAVHRQLAAIPYSCQYVRILTFGQRHRRRRHELVSFPPCTAIPYRLATSLMSPQVVVLNPLQNVTQLTRSDFVLHAGVHSHVGVGVAFQPLGRS